jgi:two-component system sensor histidine kinase/response regulator
MSDTGGAASILVVDDTVENLRLLGDMLVQRGYVVRPVTSGRQAIQAAEHTPPDLILLDVNMPGMNGYEVCERLKAIEKLRDIPVLFLTALSDTADKLKAFSAGGEDYITKPYQVDEVLARIRVHLALRRAQLDLKAQYERLQALERARDDLVHMVVHDMRSPLSVLLAHLEFLREDAAAVLQGDSADSLQAATKAAKALLRMSNDLLDVSRLEEGKLPLTPTPSDLTKIATDIRDALGTLDRERSISVTFSGPVEAVCDGGVVHRVVENLVNNAVKHTPAGGAIAISIAVVGERARVEVRDEGPGVPVEARTKIFEKFGTVVARKAGAFHSAGLGLAFCKLAIEAHRGAIGMHDAEPNGSVFWFELPR